MNSRFTLGAASPRTSPELVLLLLTSIYLAGCAAVDQRERPERGYWFEHGAERNEPTIAVFRGTRNTYCDFLQDTDWGNQNAKVEKLCIGNEHKLVAIVGTDLPHLADLEQVCDDTRLLLTDPLLGIPFPKGTVFFFPGVANKNGKPTWVREYARVFWDSLVRVQNKKRRFEKLKDLSFSRVYCHSNGCTQAQAAAKNGFISIDKLFHLGSPWGVTHTRLSGTQHITLDVAGDPFPLASVVRLIHIPFAAPGWVGMKKEGLPVQPSGAANTIRMEKIGGRDEFPHAMTMYFAAMKHWIEQLEVVRETNPSTDYGEDYDPKYDLNTLTKPEVRAAFAEYFNIKKHKYGYKGFNIQRGFQACDDSESKSDCSNSFYVNHKLAKHKFKDRNWRGRTHKNNFGSIDEAKGCIDEIVTKRYHDQVRISVYDLCGQ